MRVISNPVGDLLYDFISRKREEGESEENVVSGEMYSRNLKSSCFKAKS